MDAFDTWAAQAELPNTQALKDFGHPTEPPYIGVDARRFLEQVYRPQVEDWVTASIGGFPIVFDTEIIKTINEIEKFGCKLHFVFDGLQTNFDEPPFDNSTSKKIAEAFEAFAIKDSVNQASGKFTSSGFPSINWLCAAFKIALGKHKKPFVVAPFKAHAQLVFALQQGKVDALYGSSELFLYGAPKVITEFHIQPKTSDVQSGETNGELESESTGEVSRIVWLELDQCLKKLGGDISFELFQNALLLTGTNSLKAFPHPIDPQTSSHFKEVVNTLNQMNGNIVHYCERYPPDIRGNWLEQYMKVHQAIDHMVIMTDYETVKPRTEDTSRIPVDIHELIGLQLPAELHHYLYHGMISPRVLDWLISGRIKLSAPLAGGENEIYRRLVREGLDPWRKQALALIAFSLNRYYQRKEFTTQFWYGAEFDQKFSMGSLTTEKQAISGWRVKDAELANQLKVVQAKGSQATLGSLQFAILSISDAEFVPKTISSSRRSSSEAQLQSIEEITCNVLWRLLQIRGYIDKEHRLTDWGRFLMSAIEKVGDSTDQAETIFLVTELLRLDLLDKAPEFHKDPREEVPDPQKLGGAPEYGEKIDQKYCLFVSAIACAGRIMHEPEQYKGPLNFNHLGYHCLITEIRLALRDLIDMILTTMFLDDEIERVRDDHLEITAALPFRDHWSVGLGILSTFFLDELAATGLNSNKEKLSSNPNEPEDVIGIVVRDMARTNVKESLKLSGKLWDAFITAVKSAPAGLLSSESKKEWLETDGWYHKRRAYIGN